MDAAAADLLLVLPVVPAAVQRDAPVQVLAILPGSALEIQEQRILVAEAAVTMGQAAI